jgi:hypothetical protein
MTDENREYPPPSYVWVCSHDCETWGSDPFRAHVYEHPLTGQQWAQKEPLFRSFGRMVTLDELVSR